MRFLAPSFPLATVALLAAHSLHAQGAAPQDTRAPFESTTITNDGITIKLDVESPGVVAPVVKQSITMQATPCSATRACGPTFDLRVRSVTAPAAIAAGVAVPVSFVLDNAGKTPAPASEVAICRTSNGQCVGGPATIVSLPELAPGQTATVTQPVTLNSFSYDETTVVFGAVVDLDNMLPEKNKGNNRMQAPTATRVEAWKLEKMDESEPPRAHPSYRTGGVTFSMKVRNVSTLAPTPTTPYDLSLNAGGGWGCTDVMRHITLPSIPPRAIVTVTLTTPPLATACNPKSAFRGVSFRATADGRVGETIRWSSTFER